MIVRGILIALPLILVIQFYLLPSIVKIKVLAQSIPKRKEDLKELRRLRDELFELRRETARVNQAIQQRGQDFELLAFLEELAKKCKIEDKIVSMRPVSNLSSPPNEKIIEITIDGLVTEELTKYLYEIENSTKLLSIKKTTIRSNLGPEKSLDVSLQVSTLIDTI
ncbi:MAG: hypothetical protein K6U11_11015 [bacterium]|nr:hypothetical protein [bacterium]